MRSVKDERREKRKREWLFNKWKNFFFIGYIFLYIIKGYELFF